MTQNKQKIVVCGHYGASNIGDEAILLSLLQNLKKAKPDANVTVLSYNPENTKNSHNVESNYLLPLGFRSLFRGIFKGELKKTLKAIKNCDKFILGGGGLFTDEKIFAVFLWGLHAFCALKYNKSLYMMGQSVGPLNSRIGKWITRKAFVKAKMIYVRDTASKNLLIDLGITNDIIVAPDLVFSLDLSDNINVENFAEKLNKKIEQNEMKGYFLISLRPWKKNYNILYKNIDQIIDKIVEKYKLLPVFIPYQIINQNDEALMHKIIDRKRSKYPFLIQKFDQSIFELLHLTKNAKFTIGMRLHSIIFSIVANTKFVALSYSPKVENLLKDLKFEDFIVKKFTSELIIEKVHKVMNDDFDLKIKETEYIQNARNVIVGIFQKI